MKTLLSKFDKYWLVVLSFGFVFLFTTIFIQRTEIENLNSRIDTVNANFKRLATNDSSFVKDLKYIQFKEDSYLKQLDRDTNLILWFIAIVFGLFGVISFASFSRRVGSLEKELNDRYENQFESFKAMSEDLGYTKALLDFDSALVTDQIAENHFNKQLYDSYASLSIIAVNKRARYYLFHLDKDEKTAQYSLNLIRKNLKVLYDNLKGLKEKPIISKKDYLLYTTYTREIEEFEILEILPKVQELFEFE